MANESVMAATLAPLIFCLFVFVYIMATRYKLCPADKLLVVYGVNSTNKSSQIIHGGGRIVWPLTQSYAYLDLKPITLELDGFKASTQGNERLVMDNTVIVAISTEEARSQVAATRLLGLHEQLIHDLAMQATQSTIKSTMWKLPLESIRDDREGFMSQLTQNLDDEMAKLGLYVINVNFTHISLDKDQEKW